MKTSIAVVQIGYGFKSKPKTIHDCEALSEVDLELCEKTISVIEFFKRHDYYVFPNFDYLQKDRADDYSRQIQLWNTGQVSWESTRKKSLITLAALNAEKIKETYPGKISGHLYRQVPGLNPFSECWNAVLMMRRSKINVNIIVASDFYLKTYAPMWKARAKYAGLDIERIVLEPVAHDTGVVPPEVIKHHQSIRMKFLSRLAESSVLGHKLAMSVADSRKRKINVRGWDAYIHTKAT